MNDHDQESQAQSRPGQLPELLADRILEERLSHFFHTQAEQVHFTPALREHIVQTLPSIRSAQAKRIVQIIRPFPTTRLARPRRIVAAGLVAAVLLVLSFVWYLPHLQPSVPPSVIYRVAKVVDVAPELAHSGRLIALDPTGQHLVYQPANQAGVMYTASVADPVVSNFLAMRYVRDAAWAPDGSALVATVKPEGTFLPLLALVPTGKYMYLLGHDALAASWSPNAAQQIVYATQSAGQTQLWSVPSSGQFARLLTTLPVPLIVQHLNWSPTGQQLALTAATSSMLTQESLDQSSHAIYLMQVQTHQLQSLITLSNATIGTVAWSPDGRYLTYEQIDSRGSITLKTLDVTKRQPAFSIVPQHSLQGWNWSPDSRSLVYSDAGVLHAHVMYGANIVFPTTSAAQVSPFWLKDGRLLSMQITHGIGKLAFLKPQIK